MEIELKTYTLSIRDNLLGGFFTLKFHSRSEAIEAGRRYAAIEEDPPHITITDDDDLDHTILWHLPS